MEFLFKYRLAYYFENKLGQHHGPLCTFWLPNGEEDHIEIRLRKMRGYIHFWFERSGYKDNTGFINFDYDRHEADSETIDRQGVLDAGPLFGRMVLEYDVDEAITEVVKFNRINDENYKAFGKKVVREINQAIIIIVNILRNFYGQYWINKVESWDSRDYPLGVYCKYHLQLRYRFDEKDDWHPFIPDDEIQSLSFTSVVKQEFPELISREDWEDIKSRVRNREVPSFVMEMINEAHIYAERGEKKAAIIAACTALELAIDEKYKSQFSGNPIVEVEFSAFYNIPLKAKAIAAIAGREEDGLSLIESALYFIDLRNKIVHEGHVPPEKLAHDLTAFLKGIAAKILNVDLKLPTANLGNTLRSQNG